MAETTDRWAEYQICKRRGHQPTSEVFATFPPKQMCRWCGCQFWTTTEMHESDVPTEPVTSVRIR